jgi:hypothetical protein
MKKVTTETRRPIAIKVSSLEYFIIALSLRVCDNPVFGLTALIRLRLINL